MAEPHVCVDAGGARLYPSLEALSEAEGAHHDAARRWVFDRRGVPVLSAAAVGRRDRAFASPEAVASVRAQGPVQLMHEVNRLYTAQFDDPRVAREFLFSALGATLSILTDADAVADAFARAESTLVGGSFLTGDWDANPEWLDANRYVAVVEPSLSAPDDDAIERLVGALGRRGEAELLAVDLCSPANEEPSGYVEALVWRLPASTAALRELRAFSAYAPHVLLPVQGLEWMVVMHPDDEVLVAGGGEDFVVDYAHNMQTRVEQFEDFFIDEPWQGTPPGPEWRMYRHYRWMVDHATRA